MRECRRKRTHINQVHYKAFVGAAYAVEIQQAHNEAYAQDKSTNALSSCTTQIKANIVCYSKAGCSMLKNCTRKYYSFRRYAKKFMGTTDMFWPNHIYFSLYFKYLSDVYPFGLADKWDSVINISDYTISSCYLYVTH